MGRWFESIRAHHKTGQFFGNFSTRPSVVLCSQTNHSESRAISIAAASGIAPGAISRRGTVPQKRLRYCASGQDSFSEAEHQQLCLPVILLDRGFHLAQVVNGDHLTSALRTEGWHKPRVSWIGSAVNITEALLWVRDHCENRGKPRFGPHGARNGTAAGIFHLRWSGKCFAPTPDVESSDN